MRLPAEEQSLARPYARGSPSRAARVSRRRGSYRYTPAKDQGYQGLYEGRNTRETHLHCRTELISPYTSGCEPQKECAPRLVDCRGTSIYRVDNRSLGPPSGIVRLYRRTKDIFEFNKHWKFSVVSGPALNPRGSRPEDRGLTFRRNFRRCNCSVDGALA